MPSLQQKAQRRQRTRRMPDPRCLDPCIVRFRPNPMRLRDWISSPKSTGYEALHITVMGPKGRWVEVQIRSERMNEIAEKGYAAHYKYKQGDQKDIGIEDWLNKLQEVLENNTGNAVDFVEDFKQYSLIHYRITHYYDMVPHVPQEFLGYLHIPSEIWYNEDNTNYQLCNDNYETEDDLCSNSCSPFQCTSSDDHLYYLNVSLGTYGYC